MRKGFLGLEFVIGLHKLEFGSVLIWKAISPENHSMFSYRHEFWLVQDDV